MQYHHPDSRARYLKLHAYAYRSFRPPNCGDLPPVLVGPGVPGHPRSPLRNACTGPDQALETWPDASAGSMSSPSGNPHRRASRARCAAPTAPFSTLPAQTACAAVPGRWWHEVPWHRRSPARAPPPPPPPPPQCGPGFFSPDRCVSARRNGRDVCVEPRAVGTRSALPWYGSRFVERFCWPVRTIAWLPATRCMTSRSPQMPPQATAG